MSCLSSEKIALGLGYKKETCKLDKARFEEILRADKILRARIEWPGCNNVRVQVEKKPVKLGLVRKFL